MARKKAGLMFLRGVKRRADDLVDDLVHAHNLVENANAADEVRRARALAKEISSHLHRAVERVNDAE